MPETHKSTPNQQLILSVAFFLFANLTEGATSVSDIFRLNYLQHLPTFCVAVLHLSTHTLQTLCELCLQRNDSVFTSFETRGDSPRLKLPLSMKANTRLISF